MKKLVQRFQRFSIALFLLGTLAGCDAPTGQNGFGTGAQIGTNNEDSNIEPVEKSSNAEKPPGNINDVFQDPLKDTVILQYDPEVEKSRIKNLIQDSTLDQMQKAKAIQYVERANITELDTVSKFMDQFLEGLIVELPKKNPESITVAVDVSSTMTDNLQELDETKRIKISQDVLSEVIKRSSVTSQLPKLEIETITKEKIESSGFWPPAEVATVTSDIVNRVTEDPRFDVSTPNVNNDSSDASQQTVVENVVIMNPTDSNSTGDEAIVVPQNIVDSPQKPDGNAPANDTLNLLKTDIWDMNTSVNANATQIWDGNLMRVNIGNNGGAADWEVQPTHPLTLINGQKYLFRVKGSSTNSFQVKVRFEQSSSPYNGYYWHTVNFGGESTSSSFTFVYDRPEEPIRLTLNIGETTGEVNFEEIILIAIE